MSSTETATTKETKYSTEFLTSQVDYYRRHLGSGNWHDRNMIVAQYHYWQGLLHERNRA